MLDKCVVLDNFNISIALHTCAGRNKLTDNNVLLESEELGHSCL